MNKEHVKPIESDGQYELLVKGNRIGRFNIPDAMLEISLGEIMKNIFSRTFIVRAEHLYERTEIRYVGYCDLFEPVDFGSRAPEYQFILHNQPDGTILIDVHKC